jgi:peptidyl-Asp metalloendopeptidase
MLKSIMAIAISMSGMTAAYAQTSSAPDVFSAPNARAAATVMPTHISNMLRNKSVVWVAPIGINGSVLTDATPQLMVNLPEGTRMRVNLAKSYKTEDGSLVWSGASRLSTNGRLLLDGELPATALFVVRGQRVTGQIMTPAGEVMEILTSEDGTQHYLVKRDHSQLPQGDDTPSRVDIPAQTRPQAGTKAVNTIIRVLQIYTPIAVTELGGQNAATDRANLFIAESNTAFTNNALDVRFENAGVRFSTQAQPSNTGTTLVNALVNTSDGYVDAFATTDRNATKADLVSLVVGSALTGLCGQAAAIGATASSGFFIQNQSCSTTFTFVHEAAHLFGARHDNDPTTTPFAFGHGFVNAGGNFRTIMAVSSNPQPRLGYFSTPDQTLFRNGATRALGNTTVNNNEQVMRQRAAAIAAFLN